MGSEPHRLEALTLTLFLLLLCQELLELLGPGRPPRVPPGSSSATTQPCHRATSGSRRMGPRRLDVGRMKPGKTRLEKPRLSHPCLLRFPPDSHAGPHTNAPGTAASPPPKSPDSHQAAAPRGLRSPWEMSPAWLGVGMIKASPSAPSQGLASGRRQPPGALGNAACGREPSVEGRFASLCAGDTARGFVLSLPAPCPAPKDHQDRAGAQHQRTQRCF